MRVVRHSIFPASADEVWELLQRLETLLYITRGMVSMEPVEVPDQVREGAVIRLKIKVLNAPPAMDYEMRFVRVDPAAHVMLTNEHGGVIRHWVHRITVEQLSAGRCLYTDQIDIDAGLMTPLVAGFARVFYRIRQRRFRDLLPRSEAAEAAPW
jgi:ligand-binding SRPBCC domain-containing protein